MIKTGKFAKFEKSTVEISRKRSHELKTILLYKVIFLLFWTVPWRIRPFVKIPKKKSRKKV
jgi:hypothetical protein